MAILKKFIGSNTVGTTKIQLENNQAIRARNQAGDADVDLMKLSSSDVLQFLTLPQVSTDPSNANDLVRKSYADNLAQGVAWKQVVRATIHTDALLPAWTYDNGTGGVGATITADVDGAWDNNYSDDVAIQVGDRVLIYDDGVASVDHGIYVVTSLGSVSSPWVFTRSTDCDGSPSSGELLGATVTVTEGSTHAGWSVRMNTPAPIVVGTTPMLWDHISSGLNYQFQDGLQVAGTDVSVKADTTGGANLAKAINVSANGVAVKVDASSIEGDGTGQLRIKAGGVTAAMLDTEYLALSGGVMTGNIDMEAHKIISVADPTDPQDAATKFYVDAKVSDNAYDSTWNGVTGLAPSKNAVYDEMELKLYKSGGTMTGALTLFADPTNNLEAATKQYVDAAVGAVDLTSVVLRDGTQGMTGALDMGSNLISNVSDPVSPQDAATKAYTDTNFLPYSGGTLATLTMAGSLDMGLNPIINVQQPSNDQDAATKLYVDTAVGSIDLTPYLQKSGGTMSGTLDMGSNLISNVSEPTSPQDAATKNYVDSALAGIDLTSVVLRDGTQAMTADLNLGTNKIINVVDPTSDQDAATKAYTDGLVAIEQGAREAEDLTLLKLNGTRAMTGALDMGSHLISNVTDPSSAQDAATKNYVDSALAGIDLSAYLQKSGGTMTGALDMGSNPINNLATPSNSTDAATKDYVDTAQSSAQTYADGVAATAQSNAQTYADGVAATAQSNAQTYADGVAATAQSNAQSYADGVAATAQSNAQSYTDTQLDTLSVEQLVHERVVLDAGAGDLVSIDVAHNIVGKPIVMIGRVALLPTDDYTVSGATITWAGLVAVGGDEALSDGEIVHVYYHKAVSPFV